MGNKTVLITGARGGLGQALINEFKANGWFVIATDLESRISKKAIPGEMIREVAMDVSSGESVKAAYDQLDGEKLDMIVNNAGIDRYFPLSESPVEQFKEIFEVNVFGSCRVNQVFLPILKRPGGRIIHVSSESVKISVPFMPYPVTKQALEGYCRTLRQELRFLGIDVTVVRPGAIDTSFLEYVRQMKNPVQGSLLAAPFSRFAGQAPGEIGKIIKPEIVARYIYRIGQRKRTKLVYSINNDPKLAFTGCLPFSLMERMIYRKLSARNM
jgi:NAD(P)-dependent dehydrogenase (short-subunit alcohol dehydrogenase family)